MLLSHKFKRIGWWLLVPSLLLGIYLMVAGFDTFGVQTQMLVLYSNELFGESKFFGITEVNLLPTLVGVIFIIGCLFVGFSKEKVEDEFIKSMRLSSLQWAVFINYILLILAFLFVYGISFFNVMLYNMFTVLILFIIRFNFLLYRNSKNLANEK